MHKLFGQNRIFSAMVLLLTAAIFGSEPVQADIVINEIMYHPASGDDNQEYIELYNSGTLAVDLSGWQLAGAIDWTFPAGVSLAPDAYLVVARSVAAFGLAHNATGLQVLGGYASKLSNAGEALLLRHRLGLLIDEVPYGDAAPWPETADGDGPSLELIHPGSDNALGQNWAAGPAGGTPGLRNTAWQANPRPVVDRLAHSPLTPGAGDPVTITAFVSDDAMPLAVRLNYRTASTSPFTPIAMADDGANGDGSAADGIHGGQIPALPQGSVVEFYVEAEDEAGWRGRWPAEAPAQNALYAVDGTAYTQANPLWRVVMSPTDLQTLKTRNVYSDVLLNCTLITAERAWYRLGIRYRGASSRLIDPKGYRIEFNAADPFNGASKLNLNPNSLVQQVLAWDLFGRMGGPAQTPEPVRLIVNAQMPTTYGAMLPVDSDFIERVYPNAPDGNIYEGISKADLDYRGAASSLYLDHYVKKNNRTAADYSDIISLCQIFSTSTSDVFPGEIADMIDIDQWMRFFVFQSILGNTETGIYKEAPEEFFLYHHPLSDRFLIIPWDLDSTFADADRDVFRPSNPAILRLLRHPALVRRYYKTLLEAIDGPFSLKSMQAAMDPWRSRLSILQLDAFEQWVEGRLANLRTQIPTYLTYEGSLPQRLVDIRKGDTWQYKRGTEAPSPTTGAWAQISFNDTAWESGPSGFGYAHDDDQTYIGDMKNNYLSLYLRHSFTLTDPADVSAMWGTFDYDDGFILFLNGQEIMRRGMGFDGQPVAYNEEAIISRDATAASQSLPERVDLTAFKGRLRAGTNVLAIQAHNSYIGSNDFSMIPEFTIEAVPDRRYVYARGLVQLHGRSNAARTCAVRVGGQAAVWMPLEARWEAEVNLDSDQMDVLVESIGEDGEVFDSLTIPVYDEASATLIQTGVISENTVWTVQDSPYHLTQSLTINAGVTLTIDEGVTLLMDRPVAFTVKGGLNANGSKDAPVRFLPWSAEDWGAIALLWPNRSSVFYYCDFRHAWKGFVDDLTYSAAVTIRRGTVSMLGTSFRDCGQAIDLDPGSTLTFRQGLIAHCNGEGIHANGAYTQILDSTFIDNRDHNDAVDFNGVPPQRCVVSRCLFLGGDDDAIDMDGSNAIIEYNIFANYLSSDSRGVSAGGYTNPGPTIRNNLFYNCQAGVVVKAESRTLIDHNTIVDCRWGVRAYEKIAGGGGSAEVVNTILRGNDIPLAVDDSSTLTIRYSSVDAPWPDADEGVSDLNPMFINPQERDYRPWPGSPTRNAGEGGTYLGAFIPFAITPTPSANGLYLSEIMYHPTGPDQSEFLELGNSGNDWIDLSGYHFSQGIAFEFPNGTVVGPGEFVLVVSDLAAFEASYGTGPHVAGVFTGSLDNGGETLTLLDSGDALVFSVTYGDGGTWPKRADGQGSSLERTSPSAGPDDPQSWEASGAWGGSPGTSDSRLPDSVMISEVLSNSAWPYEDAIELRNTTPDPLDVSGWWLSDDITDPLKFRIPKTAVIPGGGYLVLYEEQFNALNPGRPFALSSGGDELCLLETTPEGDPLNFRDTVSFEGAWPNISFGQFRTSAGIDFTALASPTFGNNNPFNVVRFRNGLGDKNATYLPPTILINEIMYHPASGLDVHEYIELQNTTGADIMLNNAATGAAWRLAGGVDFTFPAGTILHAGEYLLVTSFDPATEPSSRQAFLSAYGVAGGTPMSGPWQGRLDNSGEPLRLFAPAPDVSIDGSFARILVDYVSYSDHSPWPAAADGSGASLQRRGHRSYGNEPLNWVAGPVGGTPGLINAMNTGALADWTQFE